MIPLEVLFILWLVATIAAVAFMLVLIKQRYNAFAAAMVSISTASILVSGYYTTLLYHSPSMATAVSWSRGALFVMGLAILGSSIAGIILNKDKP